MDPIDDGFLPLSSLEDEADEVEVCRNGEASVGGCYSYTALSDIMPGKLKIAIRILYLLLLLPSLNSVSYCCAPALLL